MILWVTPQTEGAIASVARERSRQEELVALGKFKETCASPDMVDRDRYLVLAEEFAEVTTLVSGAAFDAEPPEEYDRKLRAELVQVAAVAVAWVEAIDAAEAAS